MSPMFPTLESVAPEHDSIDDVTAASLAKHYAAQALVAHHTRILIDPLKDRELSDDWKRAVREERQGYAYSLLLRDIAAWAGTAMADRLAKMLWAAKNETSDYADDLTMWLKADGVNVDVLAEMGRIVRKRLDVLRGLGDS